MEISHFFHTFMDQNHISMKRFIAVILSLFAFSTLSAQEKEYLAPFTTLDVDAPIKLTLIKIMEHEAPYIIYDTKGAENPKFSFEVKDKKIKVRERSDSGRKTVTEVTIGFTQLTDISIAKADTTVEGTLSAKILDIYISKDAHFTAAVDVLDVMVYASGASRVELTGKTQYHAAEISSAHYNAHQMESISTIVEASHNGIVRVNAEERLELKTATGGKIYYYSQPIILRSEVTTFGGEIALAK